MWRVYLLRCSDNSLYCGIALDVVKRVKQHNTGKGSKYTRSRLPVNVVWIEYVGDKGKALRREAEIKRYSKQRKERLVRCSS